MRPLRTLHGATQGERAGEIHVAAQSSFHWDEPSGEESSSQECGAVAARSSCHWDEPSGVRFSARFQPTNVTLTPGGGGPVTNTCPTAAVGGHEWRQAGD
jgi:hypothetical protein